MSVTPSNRIFENNGILKSAIDKAVLSLKLTPNNIIFINILYSEDRNLTTLYSGMKYLISLRGEQKDNSPVLFYGFEGIESLKRKAEASILNSYRVDYIQMPCNVNGLKEKLKKLLKRDSIHEPLDIKSNQALLDEKRKRIISFKHVGDNIYRTLILNAELAKEALQQKPGAYPDTLQRIKKDTIANWLKEYEEIALIVKGFKIKGSQKIVKILTDALSDIELISARSISPEYCVGKILDITKKVNKVCDILAQIKNLPVQSYSSSCHK